MAAVVECRSVTKAAEQNGIKQANLSRMMRDLEETIAQPLFIRKSTGLIPTETAMVLYRHALALQKNLEQAQNLKAVQSSKPAVLKFYKPKTLTLGFLKEFTASKIKYVAPDADYQVGIFYENPLKNEKGYQTGEYELNIGGLTQKIWIVCQTDNPKACVLMDFIVSRLFA